MSNLLAGRTAVVTGGSNGIGRGIARSLADHGAAVVVADLDRDPREPDGLPTDVLIEQESSGRAAFVECDVTDYDDHVAACERAADFGGVDVMVNNAGIVRDIDFLDGDGDDFDDVIDVNLKGTYYGCQAAADRMLAGDGGTILNVSSTGAERGFTSPGGALYCASKGGVKSMTYALAEILGPTIRVNALQPGYTDETGLSSANDDAMKQARGAETALDRLATPREIGDAAVMLASDLAGYVTGEAVLVDGGWVHTRGDD